jgi:adenosylcobinamide-GDP ribazoletransferase
MPAGSAAATQLRAVAGAVAFLTRVPLGRRVRVDGADVARGAVLFPVVGAGIGAAVGLTAVLLHTRLPGLPAAALALGVGLVLTGAIHLDGLADTADALGGRSRTEALAIMRDHAVGAYGAAALALDLLVKAGVIAALLERDEAFLALIVAGALSRAAALPLAYALPYARAEVGPGGVLGGRVSLWSAGGGIAIAAAIALSLLGEGGGWMLGAVGLAAVLLGVAYRRWLGGVTGDTLGAASEISETLALAVATATL